MSESQDSIALLLHPGCHRNDFGESAASSKQMPLSGLLLRGLAAHGTASLDWCPPETEVISQS